MTMRKDGTVNGGGRQHEGASNERKINGTEKIEGKTK